MTEAGSGSIVLVGSQLAHIGIPGYATYCAVKGGVVAFARALAIDGGPLGVRVNVVSPGVVQTPMAYVDRAGLRGGGAGDRGPPPAAPDRRSPRTWPARPCSSCRTTRAG